MKEKPRICQDSIEKTISLVVRISSHQGRKDFFCWDIRRRSGHTHRSQDICYSRYWLVRTFGDQDFLTLRTFRGAGQDFMQL